MTTKTLTRETLRARRLKSFCEQLHLYLHQRCVETGRPYERLASYMRSVQRSLIKSNEDYDTLELVSYLVSPVICEMQFSQYVRWLERLL